jgi:hypothetical protein
MFLRYHSRDNEYVNFLVTGLLKYISQVTHRLTNSVALSPQENYTDCATATCRRNLVPTFVDRRGVAWSETELWKYLYFLCDPSVVA